MKTIYQADSLAEARMIVDLLECKGFNPEIEGEHLPGAVGALPAIGIVKVRVPESEARKAEELIRALNWNESDADNKSDLGKTPRVFLFFVLGVVLGTSATVWIVKTPYGTQGVDWDDDGNYEEVFTYAGDAFTRIEYDRNDDGRFDAIQRNDHRGIPSEYLVDDDFDGRYEWQTRYRNNQPFHSEADIDGDGFAEMRIRYKDGAPVEHDMLDPVSKKVKVRYYLCSGKTVAANIDRDGDGEFDASVTYDYFGLEEMWPESLFNPDVAQCERLVLLKGTTQE